MTAHIKNNITGEIRIKEFNKDIDFDEWMWTDGNFSCDCNRELFFDNVEYKDKDNYKCSEGRFSVNIYENGKLVYMEFEI